MVLHRLLGSFWLVVTLMFFFSSSELPMTASNGLLGAGFFPKVITVILAILLVSYLLSTYSKANQGIAKPAAKRSKQSILNQVIFTSSLLIALALIEFLGMLVTLGLFLFAMLIIIEKISYTRSILFSAATTVCLYIIFVRWLGLVLPWGIF